VEDRQELIAQLSGQTVKTLASLEGLGSTRCSLHLTRRDTPDLKGCGLSWSLVCVPGEIAVALCHLLEYAHTSVLLVESDAA